jgi:formylglycine-generating enzyme required for sulfatase activity
MYYINYEEVTEFCSKLTKEERRVGKLPEDWEYRLPTEAQWEYACRAGTTTATAFGDKLSSTQANFAGSSPYNGAAKGKDLERTTSVGSYKPNAWGLHDMHGNVSEWCRDWHNEAALPGGTNPEVTKQAAHRVTRGGAWKSFGVYCRSALRGFSGDRNRSQAIGFRVAAVRVSK